jgi:hypothetical protein
VGTRSGRQSPYQDDFSDPPRQKKSTSGISRIVSGIGTPTRTTVPARSRVERLLPGLPAADRVDHHLGPITVGEILDGLHRIQLAGVDGVGGAEAARPVQLRFVGVHRDDPLGPDQSRARDRGVAHTAAADHRHGVVTVDCAGVDRHTDSGHQPATQQARHRGIGGGFDLTSKTLPGAPNRTCTTLSEAITRAIYSRSGCPSRDPGAAPEP